jgi:FlgN protein
MSASWDGFRALLQEESRVLGELNTVALSMTEALVQKDVDRINASERKLEGQRLLHQQARRKRMQMQQAGFGELTLEQVCAYAPGPMRRAFQQLSREMSIKGISLAITVNNNKALILAGMDRLQKTVELIHEAMTETAGTYKRRGTVPKRQSSVIVSRKA